MTARACALMRWLAPPDSDRAAPQRESLARSEIRWRPRGWRDVARAYFAWLDYAVTGLWARHAARCAIKLFDPDVHRAVISCGPPHMAHDAGRIVSRATRLPFVMDLRDPWSLMQRLPEAMASPVWFRLAARHERRDLEDAPRLHHGRAG